MSQLGSDPDVRDAVAAVDLAKVEIVMPPQRMAAVLEIIAQRWRDASVSRDKRDTAV
jgi:hypothetical protein